MAVLKITYNKKRDSDLWQDFRSGDRDALDHIFYTYINEVINYCRRFSADNGLIDDCIQDMFLELWIKRERLGDTNSIRGYLFKTIRRKLLLELKKQSSKKTEQVDKLEIPLFDTSLDNSFLNEKAINLNEILEKLTPMQKEVVYLKYYSNLSIEEISCILKVTRKASYNYLSKALMKFRKHFEAD